MKPSKTPYWTTIRAVDPMTWIVGAGLSVLIGSFAYSFTFGANAGYLFSTSVPQIPALIHQ